MSYQQEAIKEVVDKLKGEGFLVWLAGCGLYGFYSDTDRKRVIYFEVSHGVVVYSGCYSPKNLIDGRTVGTGWAISLSGVLSGKQYATILGLTAPRWATDGLSVIYQDVDSYLKASKHSKYTEA